MNPLGLLARAYRESGVRGVRTLLRYWVIRVVTWIRGPGRECPVCGWTGREFRPLSFNVEGTIRPGAVCPGCGAWERHRLSAYFGERLLRERFPSRRPHILHVSPERCLAPLYTRLSDHYVRSDYEDPTIADLRLDLQELALPDDSYDVLVMNGVLTCVPDDRRAIASMYRVLRPGGLVIATEPVRMGVGTEEWGAGGYRHARRFYGSIDLARRFAPFHVQIDGANGALSAEIRRRFGIASHDHLVLLEKPRAGEPAARAEAERAETV